MKTKGLRGIVALTLLIGLLGTVDSLQALNLSDFHLVPDNSWRARYFADSPKDLVLSAITSGLTALRESEKDDPDGAVVIYLGDNVKHGLDQMSDRVKFWDTERVVSDLFDLYPQTNRELRKSAHECGPTLPDGRPLLVLGNNDANVDYQQSWNEQEFFSKMLDIWQRSFPDETSKKEFMKHGGFYRADLWRCRTVHRNQTLTALVLNTNMMSPNNHIVKMEESWAQLQWLNDTLTRLSTDSTGHEQRVHIYGHIAPVVDHYSSQPLWWPELIDAYLSITQPFLDSGLLAAEVFGHEHAELIRLREIHGGKPLSTTSYSPMWLHSSVSPVYGCNPSFSIANIDTKTVAPAPADRFMSFSGEEPKPIHRPHRRPSFGGHIQDWSQHVLHLGLLAEAEKRPWTTLYASFRQTYGVGSGLDDDGPDFWSNFADAATAAVQNQPSGTFDKYFANSAAGSYIVAGKKRREACNVLHRNMQEFLACTSG
eukprot:Clim_evm105s134 gene=Clim_evmTU105s134